MRSPSHRSKIEERGEQDRGGDGSKGKDRELEEEVRAGNSIRTRKELTSVVQGVLGRRRFLLRFQNGCKKNLSSNQLTIVIADKILVEEEPEVSTIPEIPEDNVKKHKGYY